MNGVSGDVEEERVNTLWKVYSPFRTINLILDIRSSFYHPGKKI